MTKGRVEAFSDGVIAIIITIMVLEMKVPHGDQLSSLMEITPIFLSYLLSYVYLGIYWSNHHHLFQAVKHVNGRILWANLHLLFWISLIPFVTGWLGENHFSGAPVAAYGFVLLMAAIAYYILARSLLSVHGRDSELGHAIGSDFKGKISAVIYAAALLISYRFPVIALASYVLVALLWIVPDRRIEREILK